MKKRKKVLKYVCAFSLAIALVGTNVTSVLAQGTTSTQAVTTAINVQYMWNPIKGSDSSLEETANKWADDYYETSVKVNATENEITLPELTANDGYVFKGWKSNVDETETIYSGTINVREMGYENIGFTAVFEEVAETPQTADATLYVSLLDEEHNLVTPQFTVTKNGKVGENATFYITDINIPSGYEYISDGSVWSRTVEYGDEDFCNIFVRPVTKTAEAKLEVSLIERTEDGDNTLKKVSLTKEGNEGETARFYVTDFEDQIPEDYELDEVATWYKDVAYGEEAFANVYVVKSVAEERKVVINFSVNSNYGKFVDSDEEMITFETTEFDDTQYKIPEVEAKEGYKFVGWKGQGNGEIKWDAEATTFGVTGLAFFAEGADTGYAIVEAQFEEVEPEERNVVVTFTLDPNKGSFVDTDENVVKIETTEFDGTQYEIPKVEAKEGYKFVGWKGQGNEVIEWDAEATTFGVTGLAFFEEGSDTGYATAEAQFEEVEPEERNVVVTFTLDPNKGSFVDTDENVVKFETTEFDGTQYEIPKVEAKEGYKFVGWKGQGNDVIEWDAEATTFGVTGLAFFMEGADTGYATVEAQFEEVEPAERNVVVTFALDPEKGSFVDTDENVVKFETTEFDGTQYEIPKVEAKEGYKFVGWKGQGNEVIEWDAEATTFGVTGLAFFMEGADTGYAIVEAQFEAVEPEKPEERTAVVTFFVNSEYGQFVDYDGEAVVIRDNEFSETQHEIPKVEAKDGYKFVGWKGQGSDVIEWDAEATTFGVTGLAYFPAGSNEGYVAIEAQFELVETPPVDPDDPDEPDTPVDPDEPDTPVNPGEPDEPDTPVDPDEPDTPVDPDEPDEPDTPVDPDEPDTPVNPDTPDTPANPDKPSVDNNNNAQNSVSKTNTEKQTTNNTVKTGDSNMAVGYIVALLSAAVVVAILALRKKLAK